MSTYVSNTAEKLKFRSIDMGAKTYGWGTTVKVSLTYSGGQIMTFLTTK